MVTGLFSGSLADLADTLAENEAVAEMFALTGGSATDGFFATMLLMTGLLVAGFAVSAVLTVSREESGGRADPVLATPISRTRWLGSHVAVASLGAAMMLALAGIGTGLGYAITTGDADEVPALTGSLAGPAPSRPGPHRRRGRPHRRRPQMVGRWPGSASS